MTLDYVCEGSNPDVIIVGASLGCVPVSQVYISGTNTPLDKVYNLYIGAANDGRVVFYSPDLSAAVYHSYGLGVWVAAETPMGVINDVPADYFSGGVGAYPAADTWSGQGAYAGKSVRPMVEGIVPMITRIVRAVE